MLSGFSGPGPRSCRFAALVLAGVLGACATQSSYSTQAKAQPLPYRFQVTSFEDERDFSDELAIADFNQDDYLALLQSKMQYSLFSTTPARLKLAVKQYQFSNYERDFTLSMVMHMTAISNLGKTFVDEDFQCVEDHFGGPADLIDLVKDGYEHPETFTQSGWQGKIKKELMDACAQKMITQFSRAVVRQAPVQGGR